VGVPWLRRVSIKEQNVQQLTEGLNLSLASDETELALVAFHPHVTAWLRCHP
jgi:hypothetical protein